MLRFLLWNNNVLGHPPDAKHRGRVRLLLRSNNVPGNLPDAKHRGRVRFLLRSNKVLSDAEVLIVKQQSSRAPARCEASRKGEVLICFLNFIENTKVHVIILSKEKPLTRHLERSREISYFCFSKSKCI